MRPIVVILALGVAPALLACNEDTRVELTFFNNTDSSLCYYEGGPLQGFCPEVKPQGRARFAGACVRGGETQMVVVLTRGEGGPEIYNRAATCKEWEESGGMVIVEELDGRLVVADSLPESTPSPPP